MHTAETAALDRLAGRPWFGCESYGLVVVEGSTDHTAVVQTHLIRRNREGEWGGEGRRGGGEGRRE